MILELALQSLGKLAIQFPSLFLTTKKEVTKTSKKRKLGGMYLKLLCIFERESVSRLPFFRQQSRLKWFFYYQQQQRAVLLVQQQLVVGVAKFVAHLSFRRGSPTLQLSLVIIEAPGTSGSRIFYRYSYSRRPRYSLATTRASRVAYKFAYYYQRATTSSDELVAHSLVALVSTLKQNFGVGERFGIVGFLSFLKSNSICIIFKTERNHSIELQKKEDQICLLMSLSGMLLQREQKIYSIIKKVYFP